MTDTAGDVCDKTAALYEVEGSYSPWMGYLVLENDTIVGTYAFRSPPRNGEVEIAYFTFPEFEGRGFATEMASFDPNREGHGARDQDFCVYVP